MFNDTLNGTTSFCEACEYEAKYKLQRASDFGLEHTCVEPTEKAKEAFGDPERIAKECADFSDFCQKFKMKWWENENHSYLSENILDELAMIAFNLLHK